MPASRAPGGVFSKTLPIRFADVDFARVLYFPRQFHFCHLVMEDFFREVLDIPYSVMLKDDRIGFPTVHLEADFMKPLEFGDEATIDMRVKEIGKTKVVFSYEVTRRGEPTGRCVQTTVAIDPVEWKSVELPPKYRKALESVMSQAG